MIKLAFFVALLAAVQSHAVTLNSVRVELYLYSREFDSGRFPIRMLTTDLKDVDNATSNETLNFISRLNDNSDTVIVVHGHGGDAFTTLNPGIKNAFLDSSLRPDTLVNVIEVDWSAYAKQSYTTASSAVAVVGWSLAEYLNVLIDQNRIQPQRLHLIGFNLGAHVVGIAGRRLNDLPARITGLDPSGRGWGPGSFRLSKSDAGYVEVIHTDGQGLLANGIGTPLGDVDFFVNGGSNQPGCLTHACSHNRAYELFTATLVREEPLYGINCSSDLQLSLNLCRGRILPVGGDYLMKLHGTENRYRVNTRRNFPY